MLQGVLTFLPTVLMDINPEDPLHFRPTDEARKLKRRFIQVTERTFTAKKMLWTCVKASELMFDWCDYEAMAAFEEGRLDELYKLVDPSL